MVRTDKLLQIQAKIEAIEERSARRKSSVENRQKKASTKVCWQEMVLKLHISSPASANRQLIEKSDGNKEEERVVATLAYTNMEDKTELVRSIYRESNFGQFCFRLSAPARRPCSRSLPTTRFTAPSRTSTT